MLSDRRQRVLCALIEEYVARALPVGSRTLTERYALGVSPATVRNDLSALEDAGYITQPHTSAGRVPTDAGYRAFVDELLSGGLDWEEAPRLDVADQLRATASELDALMEQTSAALARLTDCLSVVVAPSLLSAHICQLSLISLSDHHALVVIVAEDGQVANRHLTFADPVAPDDLAQVEALLNRVLSGRSLAEARTAARSRDLEALADPLARAVLEEVAACVQESSLGRAHRVGMSSLLRKPEFAQSQALAPVMSMLEDDTVLLHLFGDALAGGAAPCAVRIGSENGAEELAGVSVVASPYGWGDGAGVVAVIGPTRMDYSRVIRAVRAAQRALSDDERAER
ncbi:heat-inducible transcriptional repressor HrcA [Adlercreutzia faecimuris]|uniref:Heat-inducible transcription repressor HrcA n=1 Tax=Adlercreutzia faecimuris TaxID=2897341 RepID=A0ABS9WH73_9ACTN|nr:heat-inducible transcriptional repressor HrcA [Adlercreutzia sp. JBNU-10]MCI2241920.1 heat-inducible transcriptional repressor HrcA [Adlercreutzia sp. JBNU-10]